MISRKKVLGEKGVPGKSVSRGGNKAKSSPQRTKK